MKEVLFVCTLNIGRSAMAEAIVNEVYGNDYHARSAGLYTGKARPMCRDAKDALIRAGYDEKKLDFKSSETLSEKLIASSDIVVGVTAEHADALRRKFPAYADKIITFPLDVRAPSAGDAEGYDACFYSLCDGIEKILYPDGSKWKPRSRK